MSSIRYAPAVLLGLVVCACAVKPPPSEVVLPEIAPQSQPRVAAPCQPPPAARCVAVVPLGKDASAVDLATVMGDDLVRSERFVALRDLDFPERPTDPDHVDYARWQQRGVEYLVLTEAKEQRTSRFWLLDVAQRKTLLAHDLRRFTSAERRLIAHEASDLVTEQLTGVRGLASTSIAYITRVDRRGKPEYHLVVADADGGNAVVVANSREPLLSPAWSPDAGQLAYMGYERGPSSIFVVDLKTGSVRKLISESSGAGAPAWSPDGRRLAFTLHGRSGSDVYIVDIATGARRQLTHAPGINTEAAWSPDGRTIAFTSDRDGQPRAYAVNADGGAPRLLTRAGKQTLRPTYSPDGRTMALVVLEGGRYRIGLLRLETGALEMLSEGKEDEAPSFAPNGAMLIYSAQGAKAGVGELRLVSTDGNIRQKLAADTDVREAAWSPYPWSDLRLTTTQ